MIWNCLVCSLNGQFSGICGGTNIYPREMYISKKMVMVMDLGLDSCLQTLH